MIFDVAAYTKENNRRVELYMTYVLAEIAKNNPTWIEDMKNNIKDNLTKEEVEEEVTKILESPSFVKYTADFETIKSLFIIDEEYLKQFIIE